MVKRRTIILYEAEKVLLEQIQQDIAAKPGMDYTIRSLCKQYGINRYKLQHGFRQLFGDSLFHYIKICRMERARELLLQPDSSVKMVAASSGYRSAANFTTAFRKYFGITPARLKRQQVRLL
jgi:AraC-like DNA-binding protein